MTDALATALTGIRELMTRHSRALSSLEAAFEVTEAMDTETANEVLKRLIAKRYLCQAEADIAQLLAAKLDRTVIWTHLPLAPGAEWQEGRGS